MLRGAIRGSLPTTVGAAEARMRLKMAVADAEGRRNMSQEGKKSAGAERRQELLRRLAANGFDGFGGFESTCHAAVQQS
jgi:hypothetical protein